MKVEGRALTDVGRRNNHETLGKLLRKNDDKAHSKLSGRNDHEADSKISRRKDDETDGRLSNLDATSSRAASDRRSIPAQTSTATGTNFNKEGYH